MISRRQLMISAIAAIASLCLPYRRDLCWADEPSDLDARASRGRRFLSKLLDHDLGLLPEYEGANVYWLYHDNYLAAKVLQKSDPATAPTITAAMKSHGATASGKIEILFDEAERPLPFRSYRLLELKRIGEKVIKTEVVTDREAKHWTEYADLLCLAALALAKTDVGQAKKHLAAAEQMWDGAGFKDRAADKGIYATYKLALALLAARKVGGALKAEKDVTVRLLALQDQSGGWITDYNADGKPVGVANVETTCIAILAIDRPPM